MYVFLISKLLNGYDKGQVNKAPNGWSTRKEAFNTLKNTFKYDKKVCKEVEEDFPVNNTGWHDPLDVMQICAYTMLGNLNPYNATFHYRSTTRPHQGVDLFSTPNTPVYDCLDGRITFAGVQNGYGNVIILAIEESSQVEMFKNRRKGNFESFYNKTGELMDGPGFDKDADVFYLAYAHLSGFNVIKGDFVKSGDVIGFSGETGNAKGTKGPHVHFEVRDLKFAGKSTNHRCNPALYFDYEQYTPISKDNGDDKRVVSEKSFEKYNKTVKEIEIRHVDGNISIVEIKDFESDINEQYCYKENKI